MTDRQQEIYKGLRAIGNEIAQFYIDGVQIVSSDLGTKSYLLGHILREIDGGLRDIFESKSQKSILEKELTKEKLEALFEEFKNDYKNYDYLTDITFEDFKKDKGHISSIMVSFGYSTDNPIAKQYIKVARWLHKYAHRSGAFNAPRDPKDIIKIWNEFEEVLSKLIGNYYAITDRIDSITKMDEPGQEIIKTLPNLLNIESRFIYFFNSLKSSKWLPHLHKEGYFKGCLNPPPLEVDNKPGYFTMPYWGILQYLEVVADSNSKEPNEVVSKVLVEIVNEISNYQDKNGSRVENFRTDYTLFKIICCLPEDYLTEDHFDFISIALQNRWRGLIGHNFEKLLERLLEDKKKIFLSKGIQLLLSHRYIDDKPFEKVHSIFESYELSCILADYKQRLISICGLDLLSFCTKKAEEIITIDSSVFNNIYLPAIEDHEQTSFPEKFDCQLTYLIRDSLEKLPINDIIDTVGYYLKQDHPIFKRLAIHTIRKRYKALNKMFWGCKVNPLDQTLAKHEIYELIKEHAKSFSQDQVKQILKWIETKEYFIPEEFKGQDDKINKSIAYQKKEWLTALLGSNNLEIRKLIAELNNINDAEIDHPGFDSWHSSMSGNLSPLSVEDVLSMNISEIIDYFDKFNKETHNFMGPSINGLSDTIIFAIRKNPNNYNNNCSKVIESSSYFMYTWIRGLNESWRDEKINFNCNEVFETVNKIICEKKFWDAHNSNDSYCRWFISSLLSFLEDGMSDDSQAFNKNNFPVIKQILILILQNDKNKIFDYSDLSMTVLNNSKGKILMALIQYSLRLARVESKDTERWDNEIKSFFTNQVNSKNENPLLYYVLGQFLPNIHFLDENWLFRNFNLLFPIDNKTNLSASMVGYLFHHRRPSKVYFNLFLENNQYKIILENDLELLNVAAKNSFIEQICIAYLYEFNGLNLQHTLIQSLLAKKTENIYSNIIYFFWSPKFPFENKVVHKIAPLWSTIFENSIQLGESEIDKFILSGCCKWVNSVSAIDDNIKALLIKSAPHISQQDRYAVIESLSKHINNEPKKVGEILLELFQNEVSRDISRGKISEMVTILYETGISEIANKICLLHAERGFHFLRDIYIKYNT